MQSFRRNRRMKVVDLIYRDRPSLEYCKSGVGKDGLVWLSPSPILAGHIAIVCSGSAPGEAIALVVCTHTMESAATRQLSFEMIDAGEFDVRHCGLIMVAVLVEPRDWVGARATVRWLLVLRDRRRATLCRVLRAERRARQKDRNRGAESKFEPAPSIRLDCLIMPHG